MAKIGVFIPYHEKLTKYLDKVVKQFSIWDRILCRKADYKTENQPDVRNEITLLDCDYVFTVDSDEFILRKDQEKLVSLIHGLRKDAIFCPVLNYSSDLKHIYSRTDHKPVVLVNPKTVKFYETRCIRFENQYEPVSIFLHHLGFTYSEEIMRWKRKNYWNIGNLDEVSDVLKRRKEVAIFPRELKDLLCR